MFKLSISMVANITSATTVGFEGQIIEVECDSSKGLPSLQIVGLGNKAIDEAKERVRSAIKNSHLDFPAKRITINLAPANIPKDGAHFDLPIALAIISISGAVTKKSVEGGVFAGELSLDGTLRPIRGALHLAETARQNGYHSIFLPQKNAQQAAFITGIDVYGVPSLVELFLHLTGEKKLPVAVATIGDEHDTPSNTAITIDDVQGQEQAKRALLIAAAGHHNLLLNGPPGTGKTMLAKALAHLLPPLTHEEQIEVIKLHSLTNDTAEHTSAARPFRAPHHTASHIALVGGGVRPLPGEMSLAHHGVLFLDELPEYPRMSLEALRQPLEDRQVSISRAQSKVTYPANFMLIATQNPCPCGYLGDPVKECSCSQQQILHYQKKISGPLMDRLDLVVTVGRLDHEELLRRASDDKQTNTLKKIVTQARKKQYDRYKNYKTTNAQLSSKQIKEDIYLSNDVKTLLGLAVKNLDLSTRSYFKVIKVARTIADIENSDQILPSHVSEALQYRS